MSASTQPNPLKPAQRVLLLLIALGLAAGLLLLRGGMQSESPMDQLARRSPDPDIALSNGRPTIFEFYADWCQVCREMAPAMLDLERSTENKLNIVLVNVDNPRWMDLVDRYDVNGIPQLNLFAADGQPRGRSIGLRQPEELQAISQALILNQPLPTLRGVGPVSTLPEEKAESKSVANAAPRSHG
jgi:thiol-disulfide isomerase/thioredoxin